MDTDRLLAQFCAPGNQYAALPFWMLNDHLTFAELDSQLERYADAGVGGFVLHPRIGLPRDMDYLGHAFLDCVEHIVRRAAERGLIIFLYDDASYPSGSAHGLVVGVDPEYASRGIRMVRSTRAAFEADPAEVLNLRSGERVLAAAAGRWVEPGCVQADTLRVVPTRAGRLCLDGQDESVDPLDTLLITIEGFTGGVIRGLHDGEDDTQSAPPPSADLLNPAATAAFIGLTHEVYHRRLAPWFGNTIRAVFTDEPDICGRGATGWQPWTRGFLCDFYRYGNSLLDLPALFYDIGARTVQARANYRRAVYERLCASYYEPLSRWCAEHNVALCGHPQQADDIGCLRYFQLPGQDVVWRWVEPGNPNALEGRESTQAKCAADSARHRGLARNSNECLGAFGDNLRADEIKWLLDWLFVRGCNLIIPHGLYYSTRSFRAHDRPPNLGAGAHWEHLRALLPYIRRMCYILSDAVNQADTAVLCAYSDLDWAVPKVLFEHQIEFNYLEEDLLATGDAQVRGGAVHIAAQRYTTLIVPAGTALCAATLAALQAFARQGGRLVLYAHTQTALPAAACADTPQALLGLLHAERPFEPLTNMPGLRVSCFTRAGHAFCLLVNESEQPLQGRARLRGCAAAQRWDAMDGCIYPQPHTPDPWGIILPIALPVRGAWLLHLL